MINLDLVAAALIFHALVGAPGHPALQHTAISPGLGVTLDQVMAQHVVTLIAAITVNVSPAGRTRRGYSP